MKIFMVWVNETWSYSYMHYVSFDDYMIKIVYMNDVAFTYMLRYELNVSVCGIMQGLLRMYGIMGLHKFISLV